ncbi:dTDP-glucose 4,6-dehydratase 2 [Moraxella lacunata]|uniref:dTDP-glucose 4,6-dehydratase 2 n=1 Tax=Moraxella lacunata TaxID=477 RepID=A0A378TRK5_MORLA|nr:NAD-dependent epimerase [Moraxella lacunata]STZ62904.1 dTDP-glucose 4,6-dehydratase 2 [Moraxella lacunata]
MSILVTGSAGFIGSEVVLSLLGRGEKVVGVDNHNDYYDPKLKEDRLNRFINHENYIHYRINIANQKDLEKCFEKHKITSVVHLAAQAGVRYSIDNPLSYIESNLVGFAHILECCRHHSIEHLVYASSSSVYGANKTMPFSIHDNVDHPLSLYAATKKSNELMAHTYSHLYDLPTTGLRFFTVYGPWGRPDMSPFKFADAIIKGVPLQVYNYGNHQRDFTYIDDIVEGIVQVLFKPAQPNLNWSGLSPDSGSSFAPWRVYNIGNSQPVELMDYIQALEKSFGIEAKKEFLPMQAGDVLATYADVSDLIEDINYQPKTNIYEGIEKFVDWYRSYYNV